MTARRRVSHGRQPGTATTSAIKKQSARSCRRPRAVCALQILMLAAALFELHVNRWRPLVSVG